MDAKHEIMQAENGPSRSTPLGAPKYDDEYFVCGFSLQLVGFRGGRRGRSCDLFCPLGILPLRCASGTRPLKGTAAALRGVRDLLWEFSVRKGYWQIQNSQCKEPPL